ncbi:restriction endonuclease [Clostridium sp.]|uniref:restriction endonuclease n=1 Tax=Clostridium sp. TaxID=1506 RepID=UPI0032167D9C
MKLFEISLLLILLIILFKSASPLIMRFINLKEEKIKFTINIKKENIQSMTGIEFEGFCKWLFEEDPEYTNVELTLKNNDGGVDLILTSRDNEKIYVECKRYNMLTSYEYGKSITTMEEDFTIGRVICQKLVGAMVANNIKTGFIVTTGNVHDNAIKYIEDLNKNSDLTLEIFTMKDILSILENRQQQKDYSLVVEV